MTETTTTSKQATDQMQWVRQKSCQLSKEPSIYDVHTEGVRLRWTHVDGGKGQDSHRGKIQLTFQFLESQEEIVSFEPLSEGR